MKALNRNSWPAWLGVLFVIVGTLSVLDTLSVITLGAPFWASVFMLGGVGFLAIVLINNEQWWAFIPGFALLGLAVATASSMAPAGSTLREVAGAAFLALLGLGFGAIALTRREGWWAIIPMGALFTLAAIAAAPTMLDSSERAISAIFFFGLALTFGVLSLLRSAAGRMIWALSPAAMLALMGILVLGNFTNVLTLIGPLSLVAAGIAVLAGYWRRQHRHQ